MELLYTQIGTFLSSNIARHSCLFKFGVHFLVALPFLAPFNPALGRHFRVTAPFTAPLTAAAPRPMLAKPAQAPACRLFVKFLAIDEKSFGCLLRKAIIR